jgi:hypothetical protein
MFNEIPLDPTAGERARQIREVPERPQVITDPTDPRYGAVEPLPRRHGAPAPGRTQANAPGRTHPHDPTSPRANGPDAA